MGDDAFFQHVITVQGLPEMPLEALNLPTHPETKTPLTPVPRG